MLRLDSHVTSRRVMNVHGPCTIPGSNVKNMLLGLSKGDESGWHATHLWFINWCIEQRVFFMRIKGHEHQVTVEV